VLGARILAREQTVITDDLGAVIQSFPGAAFLDPTAGLLGTAALVPSNDFFDPFVGLPELIFSDRSFRTTAVAFGSSYNRGSWSVTHTVMRFEDNTRQDPDSRTDLSGVNGSVYIGSRASLSLSLQRQREKFEDLGFQRTTWLGSMNLSFTTLSGRMDWHAWQARPTRPGLTLSLFGIWTDLHDSVNRTLAISTYQVFLQATVRWPVQL